MKVLVTGGAGYIGSHTCVQLLINNYDVVVIDNFSSSSRNIIKLIEMITSKKVKLYEGDLNDKLLLNRIFNENKIDVVLHFASYKSISESVEKPIRYYHNNVSSTLNLLDIMSDYSCKKIVFSSSASVYGNPKNLPIKESDTILPSNPYGESKFMIEKILKDVYLSDNSWSIAILRYFNPVGAHSSGLIGENAGGIPNNLMPYIVKVATGELPYLNIFGNDYDTKDGTCIRDYIHVVDLADGHIKALEKVLSNCGYDCYNLGTGVGYSVLDIIKTFEKVNNVKIPYKFIDRRKGDLPIYYADINYAKNELGFCPKLNIEDMCKDAYNYGKKYSFTKKCCVIYNPNSGKNQKKFKVDTIIKIEKVLKEYKYESLFIKTEYKGHAKKILTELMGFDFVISIGGDGTFNEVMTGNYERKRRILLSHIPLGTANDIGAMYGLKKDIIENLKLILNGEKKNIDICTINNHPFVYVAGLGKFINISYDTPRDLKKKFGYIAYLIEGLREFGGKTKLYDLEYEIDGKKRTGKYSFILISNANRIAGIDNFYKEVKLDDCKFEVLFCTLKTKTEIIKSLYYLTTKDITKVNGFSFYKCDNLKIYFKDEPKKSWCIDGEKLSTEGKYFEINVVKGIEILLPKKNINKLFLN